MKLTTGINVLSMRNVEKTISKKILLANTSDKLHANGKNLSKMVGSASDPIYFNNSNNVAFNPDIRYKNTYGYSPLSGINFRNDLLIFAENNEVKKAVKIITNELIVSQLKSNKYPLFPVINLSVIPPEKQDVANAIQKYLDEIFYPKLFQMVKFKKDGLAEKIKEYLITGKLAFEIVFDNIKNPKEITNIIPIDSSTLQKFKRGDYVYYVQKPVMDSNKERIMSENQVILIEWNKYDFGYISYVDGLRRPFNVMRSMQTSKILWFAVKSQVRMHIKFNMGDVGRTEAIQKLSVAKNDYINTFIFNEDTGVVNFNGKQNNSGYSEFFTAETAQSGTPEIEEVNTQGPDLSEVDSLQFWEKYYWKETGIPFDRIDPNSSDTWGFADVGNLRKIEINFSKEIEAIRTQIGEILLKAIIIQLTLKEVEIGIDLALLDAINIEWIAFNEYDKLGELEILAKKIEICTNLAAFGEQEDVNGVVRKAIPLKWIIENYLDFTPEQRASMEQARRQENVQLGFEPDTTTKTEEAPVEEETEEAPVEEETEENIAAADDTEF